MLTTGTDSLIGTAGNDIFTGAVTSSAATTTLTAGDIIVDQSSTDNDTLNLTLNAGLNTNLTAKGVENVNLTVAETAASNNDVTNLSGVKNLTVTKTNPVVGGVSIVGNKAVQVINLKATDIAKVTAGADTTNLSVSQALANAANSKTGVVVDGDAATGTVSVTGAATVNAAAATGDVTVTAINNLFSPSFTQNAKAVTINAAASIGTVSVAASGGNKFKGEVTVNAAVADTVSVDNDSDALSVVGRVDGPVTVNAAKATTVTVADATSGATVNAATTNLTSATINVSEISSKGATITVGTGQASSVPSAKQIIINLTGTTNSSTEVANVAGAGTITLAAGTVNNLNLSGNGADVTYVLSGTPTAITGSGEKLVNVKATTAVLDGNTVTGVNTLSITGHTDAAAGAAASIDMTKATVTSIGLETDLNSGAAGLAGIDILAVADGAKVTLTANQTTGFKVATASAGQTVTLNVGDTNGAANTATPTFTTGTLDLSGVQGSATSNGKVNLDATVGKVSVTTTTINANTSLVITGNKEVNLGTLGASKGVDGSAMTGKLLMTADTGAGASIKSGTAADEITLNDAAKVFTVEAGDGDNIITLQAMAAGATVVTGSGADTITGLGGASTSATSVLVLGAGDDKVTLAGAADAVINFGDGSADELIVAASANQSAYGNVAAGSYDFPNFAISGVERVTLDTAVSLTLSATQFASDNIFRLSSDKGTLTVVGNKTGATGAGVASVIDASGVTRATASTAKVVLEGSTKGDTITGSAGADTINGTSGADSISGGDGTDTLTYASLLTGNDLEPVNGVSGAAQQGLVINLGSTEVTAATVVASMTGKVTATAITTIAAGQTAYLYNSADTASKSAVQQSIAGIETVVGTSGADYIVASSAGNTITGGAGADVIRLGAGTDTVVYANSADGADSIASFAVASDVIRFVDGANLQLNGNATIGYVEGALGSLTVASGQNIIVITDAQSGLTSAAAIDLALNTYADTTLSGGVIVIFKTGATGDAQVWFDAAAQTNQSGANTVQIATLVGLTDLTTLSASNFAVVA